MAVSRTVFMLFIGFALAHDEGSHSRLPRCDRKRCRLARAILKEEFYPAVAKLNFTLPDSCPFAPNNDIYLDNELNKKEVRFQNWRCLYCNKIFRTEEYIENHFVNRHNHTIKYDGVCLADYCTLLECDLHSEERQTLACNSKTMRKRQHSCLALVDRCFPPHHSNAATQLHHEFEKLYCSHLKCDLNSKRSLSPPNSILKSSARQLVLSKEEASKSAGWRNFSFIVFILFLLLLLIFYIGVCLYRKDMSIMDDLRKLSGVRRRRRMELMKAKQF